MILVSVYAEQSVPYFYVFSFTLFVFFFSSRRRHTRCLSDWSSDVCSSDLEDGIAPAKIVCIPNCLADDAFLPPPAAERSRWRERLGLPTGAVAIGIVARLDRKSVV